MTWTDIAKEILLGLLVSSVFIGIGWVLLAGIMGG